MTLYILIGSLSWLSAYLIAARLGIKNAKYGMPALPLSMNLMWEMYYSIQFFGGLSRSINTLIAALWFCVDLLILGTYLRSSEPKKDKIRYIIMMPLWIMTMFILKNRLDAYQHAIITAFSINIIMSICYLIEAKKQGENFIFDKMIGYFKMIGTLAYSLEYCSGYGLGGMIYISGFICLILDIIYIYKISTVAALSQK